MSFVFKYFRQKKLIPFSHAISEAEIEVMNLQTELFEIATSLQQVKKETDLLYQAYVDIIIHQIQFRKTFNNKTFP